MLRRGVLLVLGGCRNVPKISSFRCVLLLCEARNQKKRCVTKRSRETGSDQLSTVLSPRQNQKLAAKVSKIISSTFSHRTLLLLGGYKSLPSVSLKTALSVSPLVKDNISYVRYLCYFQTRNRKHTRIGDIFPSVDTHSLWRGEWLLTKAFHGFKRR